MGFGETVDLVPVTVVAGYLGAGKTTLINELLALKHGRRLAVLVNDFGAVNIDAALIAEHRGRTISLTNGCVCCSIADELGDALDEVLALEPVPDQIVIEASGVADPVNVAAYGQGWPGCRLDAVIVVADAETIRARADDQFVGELVVRQLRRADIVLATKCDLLPADELPAAIAWLAEQSPGTPTVPHRRGQLDARLLLETDRAIERTTPVPVNGVPDRADTAFESAVIELDSPVDRARVEAALRDWPEAVLRVKGIARFDDDANGFHIIQRVGHRWTIEEAPSSVDASHTGKLVVLGRRGTLDHRALTASLSNTVCLAPSSQFAQPL
jgi:G3E family GTPase